MSEKPANAVVNIKIKKDSGDCGDSDDAGYRAANSETEALIKQKLVVNGFKGTFADATGNEINAEDIDDLFIYVSRGVDGEGSEVFISFNKYFDLVFVKRVEGNVINDAEKVRSVIQEYLAS
jgi:hypothetical protein